MTIQEVLAQVDEMKPNAIDDNQKLAWLSELDGKIFNSVILTHEQDPEDALTEFSGYKLEDMDKDLLVGFPYSDLYRYYIMAQIDFVNGETDRYVNSSAMFNSSYKQFLAYYNRTNVPLSKPMKF